MSTVCLNALSFSHVVGRLVVSIQIQHNRSASKAIILNVSFSHISKVKAKVSLRINQESSSSDMETSKFVISDH